MDTLRAALAVYWGPVVELLRAWDVDEFETIDFRTFSRALPLLNLKVDPQHARTLFSEFELDEEGSVALDDLTYHLRIAAGLLDGAALAAAPTPPQMVTLDLDPASDEPLAEQLGRALGVRELRKRLGALLREWDVDGTGTVDARDLRQALALLGVGMPEAPEQVEKSGLASPASSAPCGFLLTLTPPEFLQPLWPPPLLPLPRTASA